MSIFGTPEERKRRQQEQEEALARAKQKLIALWSRIPGPVFTALIGVLGIIIGTIVGSNMARSANEAQWHRDRLTQLYSDCMYYSFRLETALSTTKKVEWNSIKDDASQTLRAGNLLWAYLKKPQWEEMSEALSALQTYSIGYAYGVPLSNDRDHLRAAAEQIYHVAHMSYQYDGRIFERWKSLIGYEDEDTDTKKSSPSPTSVPKTQSAFHPHAQRNPFRLIGSRQNRF